MFTIRSALVLAFAATLSLSACSATPGSSAIDKSGDTQLQNLVSNVMPRFQRLEYFDAETGLTVPYNLFVHEGHDKAQTLPMVTFIADASWLDRTCRPRCDRALADLSGLRQKIGPGSPL